MDGIEGIVNQQLIDQAVEDTRLGNSDGDGFDGEMFLQILMAQLQNQSPFDTVETEQILQQQATLTEVEQSVKQTSSLTDLQETVGASLAEMTATLSNINNTLNTLVNEQNGGGES